MKFVKIVNKKWLENYLATDKDYLSDEFWQSDDSEDVFYDDGDIETVKKEIASYMKDLKDDGVSNADEDELFEIFHLIDKDVDRYVALYLNN